ncbi:MAG: ferritin-like domain-containing protein [Flavobacterium sp.]|nr:ferritin-like domain-containing protein [Flavobacterium sp.]
MENNLNNFKNGILSKEDSTNSTMQVSQLMKLFEDELKDIFWAEKALTKAIPLMIKNATSIDLIEGLTAHLEETNNHVERLAQVFTLIDKKPTAKKCLAMEGIIKEGGEIMESCEAGAMRDAGIISTAQKVEHYEIATYRTLRQFAKTLGLREVAELLKSTLKEEKATDKKLSEVAMDTLNITEAEKAIKHK